MPAIGKEKLTKEEERLLRDYSRQVSKTTSALFYVNAFFVSAIPLWLFIRIHHMDVFDMISAALFVIMTLVDTYLVAQAYMKVKFTMKHKIANKRKDAVTREVTKQLSESAEGKKLSRQEKDKRIDYRKSEVADNEATLFSIFYNNTLFLFLLIAVFYLLRSFSPYANYVTSTAAAGSLAYLFSTGS
ncbi:translocon-associated protein subunit gamma-like [Sycon ciliatum]|uniref:translocon-associated protein subunit gamma-like n=1 Tax=Sycon ciliatum TaxID=27933 RepID=UPI0020A8A005|eukprot:scpid69500/ scgid30083/ Translocon-associated protein subunit gamma; Signal sequence receptor subunit gamma; Translocon-associated protein subunit gamma; Signal sequence receptor subunit gamma